MSRAIAILGASGAVGTALAAQILRSNLLEAGDRLQIVGHGASASEARLLGTRIDLMDAFDDDGVEIEMVPRIDDVDADIIIVASGASTLTKDRREIGKMNRAIFEEIAGTCAQHVPNAIFVVVSNPVELGVRILASRIDRTRIFGMGAQQDSLRFARAIAHDLHISRKSVRAAVLGEHGQAMVPLWSSVELFVSQRECFDALGQLKIKSTETPLYQRVKELQSEVLALLDSNLIPEAYEATRRALPDARTFVQPFVTLRTMNSTPNATSNATLMCLNALIAADRRVVHAQVMLEGEFCGISGVCGIPVILSPLGWQSAAQDGITDSELRMLADSVQSINSFAASVLRSPAVAG